MTTDRVQDRLDTVALKASSDPTSPKFAGPCPRCGGPVPNADRPGAYPGALSRLDNATYICSACGTEEALFNYFRRGEPLPPFGERAAA